MKDKLGAKNLAALLPGIFLVTAVYIQACGANGSDASRAASLLADARANGSIALHCVPFPRGDLSGAAEGHLDLRPTGNGSYAAQGPVAILWGLPGEAVNRATATLNGVFIPGNPREHFHTNYLDGKLVGSAPMINASLSFWPERGNMSFSALYRTDGYRFSMDCSRSHITL